MKTKLRFLSAAIITMGLSSLPLSAMADENKDQLKQEARDICQQEAQQRYGEKAIKSVAKKVKWSNGLKGAKVEMKIKPKSKKSSKYACVVALDKSVKFYKR